MIRRVAGTAVVLALLSTLLACSDDEHVVPATSPPTPSPTPPPPVPADKSLVRFVSPKGNDKNPGTLDRPWRTLQWAFKRIYQGQVLMVRGGEYHENINHIPLHNGRSDHPITVRAYPGENPVLVGSMSLRRPTYWTFDNLDVRGDPSARAQPSFMVKMVGGNTWTWENSEFSGPTGRASMLITGWGAAEPTRFAFRGNCLHQLPKPPAGSTNLFLGAMGPAASGTVSRNVIFNDDRQPNVRIGSGAGAPSRVRLLRNTIYGGSLAIDVRGRPHRVLIERNIVGGNRAPAVIRFAQGSTHGTTVSNNATVSARQLLRPLVDPSRAEPSADPSSSVGPSSSAAPSKGAAVRTVKGRGNVVVPGAPGFVDTSQCNGYQTDLDALIPYGAEAL